MIELFDMSGVVLMIVMFISLAYGLKFEAEDFENIIIISKHMSEYRDVYLLGIYMILEHLQFITF